jgi:GT2 family glycosyltransferase
VKVVVGCPVRDRAWTIPEWYAGIEAQDIDVDVMCLVSPSVDNTEELLRERGVITFTLDDPGPRTKTQIDGHMWTEGAYIYMARLRNALTYYAQQYGADYFLSLDSDIVLPKGGLAKMLEYAKAHMGVVAPAVNMGWRNTAWNTMDWVDYNRPSVAHRPVIEPRGGQADVVMAAMLLDRIAMEKCAWAMHEQGEDVGFSLVARQQQVPLWWLPEVRCLHLMRQV